ncbi:MAG: response regulator [Variibacter sp.]|nr:response regulator [Variibacter sp.]
MQSKLANKMSTLLGRAQVLIVDDNPHMRKLVRNLLVTLGVKAVYEAGDGVAGLEAIRQHEPDLVILDWEMPRLSGPELVRTVRSPGVFPLPDVPIILLTVHAERWRVLEAARLGVNEVLRKPVSAKALMDRMLAIFAYPRPMVRIGDYYGPAPRKPLAEAAEEILRVGKAPADPLAVLRVAAPTSASLGH